MKNHAATLALFEAMADQDPDDLQVAIDHGADTNASKIFGKWVPLDFALPLGEDFVKPLLDAGADPRKMASLSKDPTALDLLRDEDEELIAMLTAVSQELSLRERQGILARPSQKVV